MLHQPIDAEAARDFGRADARAAYLELAMQSGDLYFAVDALAAFVNALGHDAVCARAGMDPVRTRAALAGGSLDAIGFLRLVGAVGLELRPEARPAG